MVTSGVSGRHDHEPHDLHAFEFEIRTELARAEAEEPDLHLGIVAAEPVSGPKHLGYEEVKFEETERYEAGLQSLLGAIVSVEMDWAAIQAAGMTSLEMKPAEIGSIGGEASNDDPGRG